ncbi:MAG: hypothetical protein QXZ22_09170 [Sulfolobales archaeon]
MQTQSVSVSGTNTVPINYTSPGSGYLEVMVVAPSNVSAFLVVNSASIFLQNVVTVIPINEGDTINEIQLLSSGSATALVSARLLPISAAPNVVSSLIASSSTSSQALSGTITITSNTVMYVPTNVLVVAVGAGGAGGGTGEETCYAGNGGNTIVSNSYQSIIAGGGGGGWSGNLNGSASVCEGCAYGPGGSGGTGSVSNVQYYQILNGNAGGNGNYDIGGSGAAIPTGYNLAIQQVLSAAGYLPTSPLSIPSTPGTNSSEGSGYGAGGGGNSGSSGNGGGGGGSGAVVVGIMSPGIFNITVAPLNTQVTTCAGYANSSYAYGRPGVVYLIPLPE